MYQTSPGVAGRADRIYLQLRNPFRIGIGPRLDSTAEQPWAVLQNPVGIPLCDLRKDGES
jgi:hypothetical protein